jgi:hypothetical protein
VTLTATPGPDAIFTSWSGCNSVSGTSCTVTMSSARTATATFQPATYVLTVLVSGVGTVEGPGILCTTGSTGDCSELEANGDSVTLTAVPADGVPFGGWYGCASISGTSCTVNMNATRTVTARF